MSADTPEKYAAPMVRAARSEEALIIELSGDWLLGQSTPDTAPLFSQLESPPRPAHIGFDTTGLGQWDSSLVTLLARVRRIAESGDHKIGFDTDALPEGARSLLDLAFAVAERKGARRDPQKKTFLEQIGDATLDTWQAGAELVEFTGELVLSFKRILTGKATVQRSQIWLTMQEAGVEALPIVGLISFLIGMIFAFVGVMQLAPFGAGIYTADLVAVAMLREMAPIMTGILMAGRTGAAYAAQIGTMKVNEEVDALTTMGVNPIDFLVMPRFLALTIMMPFLTMYASLLGILGGGAVALAMLDVSATQYVNQTNSALSLNTLLGGLFKAFVYGGLVALAGTQQGMACGSSAMAVGQCTTKAVVSGIVLIVVSASLLTIIYVNLGI